MSLRENVFWFIDAFRGKKIRSHLNHVASINNGNWESSKEERLKTVNNLLDHAVKTTPYYQQYSTFKSISDFPVIKKTTIQNNFDAFRSTQFLDKKFVEVATSGSTGVPFFLYQDSNKKSRNSADTLYFLKQTNFNIGDRLYDIEVWRDINVNSPLKAWMQNLVYIDSAKFTDDAIEALLLKLKKDKSPKCIMGFASALELICKYLEARHIKEDELWDLNITCIIAISEYMTAYVQETMQKYFNVPVISRYSNEELGIIAQQLPNNNERFKINWASYHVEVLKMDADEPAQVGELGRIVITDLYNYCMPIIRYDTGDIGAFDHTANNTTEPCFKQIQGRKMDAVFNTSGGLVSSFLIYTKFYKYYHLLKQYQFIQDGKASYLIKLNTHTGEFEHQRELINNVKKDFGEDALVRIELVDEIPPLSSGKRKKVVNLLT